MTQSQAVGPFRVRPRLWRGAQTGKWFVDVPASLTSAGKRKRKLFDNQGGAQAAAQRLRDSIDDAAGLLKVREHNAGASFSDAADGWLADEELRVATLKKRAASLMVNGYRLNAARAFFSKAPLAAITERRLTEYQAARLKAGRKPVSINADMQTIRQVLKWAVKQGMIDAAPEVEAIPTRPVKVIAPTPEENDGWSWVIRTPGCRLPNARTSKFSPQKPKSNQSISLDVIRRFSFACGWVAGRVG